MPNANNNKMLIYGGIGVAVLVVIIIAFVMMKKEKYVGAATFGAAPLQKGGLMLESDANGNLSTSATLPIGSIVLWYGKQSTIPVGWALCDGTNGTPNMLGRFALGATDDGANPYSFGVRGGTGTVQLVTDNVPLMTACSRKDCLLKSSVANVVTSNGPNYISQSIGNDLNLANSNYFALGKDTGYSDSAYIGSKDGALVQGPPSPFTIIPPFVAVYYIMKIQ